MDECARRKLFFNGQGNRQPSAVTTSSAIAITVSAANVAPAVSITSPANNASFTTGSTVTINANATDSDGTVAKVEFFQGTTKLGEDLTTPYAFAWTSVPAGNYSITVKQPII